MLIQPAYVPLVQESIAQVRPIAALAGRCFYERLFEAAPHLRPLFKGDLREQSHKLMATLEFIARHLGRLDEVAPRIVALGARHQSYGALEAHYAVVGRVLIGTLEHLLGPAFTAAHRAAWSEAYAVLAALMQAGAMGTDAEPGGTEGQKKQTPGWGSDGVWRHEG